MQLFYAPDFTPANPLLPEDESRHAVKVLRLSKGEEVHVTDGRGTLYTATLTEPHEKRCRLQINATQEEYGKRPYFVHLAIAPPKNTDRLEWLVEKCVEMGIDSLSLVQCERSERKFQRTDRLEKIAVAAMKQSLKAYLPHLNESLPLAAFLDNVAETGKFVAHLLEGERRLLQAAASPNESYCVLIGPEGDFTPSEVQKALAAGFQPVSLGESRLRTETAGLVAVLTLHLLNAS